MHFGPEIAKLMSSDQNTYLTRKATEIDVPALEDVTGRDESRRLKAEGRSHHPENCMLVVEENERIIGSVFLVFVRPPLWPNTDDPSQLPQLISLVVKKEHRNKGVGTCLIRAVEKEVISRGLTHLYLGVDPIENPGALRLYRRLGFESISQEPYRSTYTNTDDNGDTHEIVEWRIDMRKRTS
jgi:ribosomal protein S18 acetylase RimI-like enzyme